MKVFFTIFLAIININLSYSQTLDSNRIKYFNSILEGLNKSYIIDYTTYNYWSVCPKHQLVDTNNIKDSILYYNAVENFKNCDEGILNYLLSFERDTSKCLWIRTKCNAYPKYSKIYHLLRCKRIAALVLIENYLENYQDSVIRIPRIPNFYSVDIIQNLCLLDYESLKKWIYLLKGNGLRKLFNEFRSPEYKIYSDYYYGM